MKKHTPTPWTIGDFQENAYVNQRPINPCIGVVYGDKEQTLSNAAFIVSAVNAHDALIEALNSVVELSLTHSGDPYIIIGRLGEIAEEALKLAHGELNERRD